MSTEHFAVGPNGAVVAETALTAGDSLLTAPTTNTATVWVDSGPVTGPLGVELTPGSSQPWPAGKPLHAWAASSADLYVTDGLDTGTNPGAVASAILAQGLADQIAAKIAVTGAPPVDPLTTIETDSVTVAAGQPHNSAWLNVSGFQSISVRLAEVTGTVYGTPLPRRVTLWWSDANNGIPFAEESLFIADTNGNAFGSLVAFTTYNTAVKAAWVQIQWASTTRGAELDSWVTGSYKSVTRASYLHQSGYSQAIPAGWAGYGNGLDRLGAIYTSGTLFQNGVDYWWYPNVSSGAGYRSVVANPAGNPPAGGSLDAFIYAMAESPVALYGKRAYAGPFPLEDDNPLIIPFCPIGVRLRYNNNTLGTWAPTVSIALTYER